MLNDSKGVSPVIGVILMVAITVILAAVIAAFVFGMDDRPAPTASGKIDAVRQSSELEITYNGDDSLRLSDIKITVKSDDGKNVYSNEGLTGTLSDGKTLRINIDAFKDQEITVQMVYKPSHTLIFSKKMYK